MHALQPATVEPAGDMDQETVCDYLFWVRRRLTYQQLAQGRFGIDNDQCLSIRENRKALSGLLAEDPPRLEAMPAIQRGSMHYPRRGRGE